MRESSGILRAVIGLAQGIALYFLYRAFEAKAWPATDGLVFAPLLLVSVFIPTVAVAGWGNLRPRNFAIWIIAASFILAGLGAYDILRDPGGAVAGGVSQILPQLGEASRNVPSATLWPAVAAGLFIAHALIVSGDADRKLVASYGRYFDIAWKHGVQIVLAVLFVGAFWAVLFLGAELFKLIKIDWPAELIKKAWFAMPATALATAYAIHVTDVRAAIVRGVRTLTLTLLSWLLPMMAAMAVAFLAALVFTGLEPLWSTRRATSVLLLAAAALILLVNATYQDGDPERPVVRPLRYAGTATAVALVPLVAIAAYAVTLRVGQYGWTPERIIATACVVVAACYALGYAFAAAASRAWLKGIRATNIFAAFVVLAVLLVLFSPVGDPARISVADQVARLESGAIAPDKFDFAFLRFKSGRYGREALDRLRNEQDGPNAARIAESANAIFAAKTPSETQSQANRVTASERAANISVVFPKGTPLPASFLQQDWNAMPQPWQLPRCLSARAQCEAVVLDLDRDGKPEILVFGRPLAVAFKEIDGKWSSLGNIANAYCNGVLDALRDGKFEFAPPALNELQVAGQHLRVETGCKQ